ncbi:hypothetical protein K7432_014107 [Basidiobolus ranarum]|uniref:Cupin type-1 domain-containing protein n=1 Tax=Basidiobolus ranarum TaxID=34480 RepID=A0ABR2WIA6_9FUNG
MRLFVTMRLGVISESSLSKTMSISSLKSVRLRTHVLPRLGYFPNSEFHQLPLLIYQNVLSFSETSDAGSFVEELFRKNGFLPQWRYGMYKQSHYHSNTHEVLGVICGGALLRFGGEDKGVVEERVHTGDVLVIPVGVGHRAVEEDGNFQMVGAYAKDSPSWDMNYGSNQQEYDQATLNIHKVPLPKSDPVYGKGPLLKLWT